MDNFPTIGNIFQDFIHCMTHMCGTIGIWRSIMENPKRISYKLFDEKKIFNAIYNFFFKSRNKIQITNQILPIVWNIQLEIRRILLYFRRFLSFFRLLIAVEMSFLVAKSLNSIWNEFEKWVFNVFKPFLALISESFICTHFLLALGFEEHKRILEIDKWSLALVLNIVIAGLKMKFVLFIYFFAIKRGFVFMSYERCVN